MENLDSLLDQYYDFCEMQKKLDEKTMKAYRIDLRQFREFIEPQHEPFSRPVLERYCRSLHVQFKPRTVKRKIASAKAFCHWLEYEEIVGQSPFAKVKTKFREPKTLPRVISSEAVAAIFQVAYGEVKNAATPVAYKTALRKVAVLEMLFATGMRVSELTHLANNAVDLQEGKVRIYGKGDKERIVQIGNSDTLSILRKYREQFYEEISSIGWFFLNGQSKRLSEQSVRLFLKHCKEKAGIEDTVTPHVLRHTVATLLLEEGVDIRYIQEFLGHSSISVTEIYTHVSTSRQRELLVQKHPRNTMCVDPN